MSPFTNMTDEILEDNVTGKKNFESLGSVANFYKHRLRCFEEVRVDQPIIKVMQLGHFSQPNRMKARYSDQIAKQADIDFPPLRADKKLNPVFLLPQFCFVYPVGRALLNGDVTYLPLISRQLVCFCLVDCVGTCAASKRLSESVWIAFYTPVTASMCANYSCCGIFNWFNR
jgi:hypothetical protein